jgi:hypothetical protein
MPTRTRHGSVSFSITASTDLAALKEDFSKRYLSSKAALAQKATMLFAGAPVPDPTTNVVGVGVGEKNALDAPTGVMALKFFVRHKIPDQYLNDKTRLPRSLDGLPTDVEEIGIVRAFAMRKAAAVALAAAMPNPRTKMRPAHPGCSVGFQLPRALMAGTFGALVKASGGKVCILSNNHVLANENRLPLGDPIFQPGLLDGGNPATDQIAKLDRFVALSATGVNEVDAAIASVLKKTEVSRDVLFIGRPTGVTPARIDMIVHKFGRTTDYTVGIITSINTDITISYDIGSLFFSEQVLIRSLNPQPFSKAGDSGSLILERETNRATALLFAGSATHTIANHFQKVLDALKVKLV